MRLLFTFFLLISTITTYSQTYKGTILFNDGTSKTGIIKSFIEDKIINLNLIDDLEHELNLDDKNLKFKENETDEFQKIAIDEIDEVILKNTTYKVLILKDLTSTGELKENGKKVFLPYVRKGAINIFGIRYTETTSGSIPPSSMNTRSLRFYYQNPKENYAINYQNIGTLDLFTFKKRYTNPLLDLFKDCPQIVNDLEAFLENKKGTNTKDYREEEKRLKKEFKKLPKEEKYKLDVFHKYNFCHIEDLISQYENCK